MIEMIIPYRSANIGAFSVRRVLPFRKRRSVGPFVFVDDFGPFEALADEKLDVLAHPHIGLATVTYLFSGRMMHRDSLGTVQAIEPGEVNWMSSGGGIVHSERVSDAGNAPGTNIVGVQTWVALPENMQEGAGSFAHYGREEIPSTEGDGIDIRLIMGNAFGIGSPVESVSEPFYAECSVRMGRAVSIPKDIEERSAYVLSGKVVIDGTEFESGTMVVFVEGTDAEILAAEDSRLLIIGGRRLEKPRFMWWNFVSTSQDLIEKARTDWGEGNFAPIPNETGRVPLPESHIPKPEPQPL